MPTPLVFHLVLMNFTSYSKYSFPFFFTLFPFLSHHFFHTPTVVFSISYYDLHLLKKGKSTGKERFFFLYSFMILSLVISYSPFMPNYVKLCLPSLSNRVCWHKNLDKTILYLFSDWINIWLLYVLFIFFLFLWLAPSR